MKNERGYAVLLVMLLLGMVTLIGVTLMTMSRLDLKLTGAMKNYDKMFNLADGACGMSFNDLKVNDRESQTSYIGPLDPNIAGSGPQQIGPLNTSPAQSSEQNVGTYKVYETLQTFDDSSKHQPGWEAGPVSGGGYYMEDWTGQGNAYRQTGMLMVEQATVKRK